MVIKVSNIDCFIDDDDFQLVSKYSWFIHNGYARGYDIYGDNHKKRIFMHRLIMGLKNLELFVDHINGNRLDNRRINLRTCNASQNSKNARKCKGAKFKYKGVWIENRKKTDGTEYKLIRAKVGNRHLGCFDSEISAAIAYDTAAKKYFGEFAHTNF